MKQKHDVLFEVGIEELPARFIDDAEAQLLDKTTSWLKEERIGFDKAVTFSTPRRLAIRIEGIEEEQATVVEKVRGPKMAIAKDEEGNWTKAAIGFTKGQGKTLDDILVEDVNGEAYIFVEKRIEGRPTFDVLKDFPKIIGAIHFPQTMRWGSFDYRFARPIRWLLGMMDEEVIPFQIENIQSDRITYGHRFLGKEIHLSHPSEYEKALEEVYVIVSPKKREEMIIEQIEQIEKERGFYVEVDPGLLNEVRNLVEYPTAFSGAYDEDFLSLPEEVLITSMREHQRYFPVFKDKDKESLLPYFVSVRNGDDRAIENVVQGNEKVLRARLADGRFFYDDDRKHSIDFYMNKLKSVIFQEELGTVYEKVERVTNLAKSISKELDVSKEQQALIERAAYISKFDLVTSMVNEFPELQGVIGEKYALHFKEDEEVAKAVREHYKPLHAKDELPSSVVSTIVSIADKLDTIVGTISIGLIPTGSQDPYGLRRQAIGVLRMLLDNRWTIPFERFLSLAKEEFAEVEHEEALTNFFKDRVVYLFSEAGIEKDVIDAVLHDEIGVLTYKLDKANLLSDKRADESFKLTQESFVRVLNLANKEPTTAEVKEEHLSSASEKALFEALQKVEKDFIAYETAYDALKGLDVLVTLSEPIHDFFEHNMVMDPNEDIRTNRLALVNRIARLMKRYADLTLIEWRQHQ